MHRNCAGVEAELEESLERIVEQDLAVLYGDRPYRDDAVSAWIESGGFRVEHNEADAINRGVILPRRVEAFTITLNKRKANQSVFSHFISAVNSSRRKMD